MSVFDCLELVHSSPGRQRYRIHTSDTVHWAQLRSALTTALRPHAVTWRLNPTASSLLIRHQPASGAIHEDAQAVAASLRAVHRSLLASLADLGIAPPPSRPVIQIHTRRLRRGSRSPAMPPPLRWLINLLSSAIALVMVLAAALIELAFALRRPSGRATVA